MDAAIRGQVSAVKTSSVANVNRGTTRTLPKPGVVPLVKKELILSKSL